jgi:hypothetical protein
LVWHDIAHIISLVWQDARNSLVWQMAVTVWFGRWP